MITIISLFLIISILFVIYKCILNVEGYSPFIFHFAKCDTAHIRNDLHLCKNQHHDEMSCNNSVLNCKWDSAKNECFNITKCSDLQTLEECNERSKTIGYLNRMTCYWDNIFQKCFKA